jgi:hypothetical protein
MVLPSLGCTVAADTRKGNADVLLLQRVLLSLVTLLVAGLLGVPAMARQRGVHGIDVADMDLAVSPQGDFYRFDNGGWLDRVDIPAARIKRPAAHNRRCPERLCVHCGQRFRCERFGSILRRGVPSGPGNP